MKKRKLFRRALWIVAALAVVCVAGFLIYASNYYRADDVAVSVMCTDSAVTARGDLTVLSPTVPTDTGLIFYPGAKVEAIAYLPILEKIERECGVTCVLVQMPFNMAIFDPNAADKVMEEFPNIRTWYIAGHSMGGAMASDYASKHQDKVQGLILLGAYIYGDYPAARALTVYGSLNTSVAEHIDYTENVVCIQGGNHAQFGNYGRQRGDADAEISREEQQDAAVEAIRDFLEKTG